MHLLSMFLVNEELKVFVFTVFVITVFVSFIGLNVARPTLTIQDATTRSAETRI